MNTIDKCTCGSGAHPRHCLKHPEGYEEHLKELDEEFRQQDREEEELKMSNMNAVLHRIKNKPLFCFALREDLVDEKQFLPTRAEPKATGWDVRAAMLDRQPLALQPFQKVAIPLGFRSFCPDGWWYEIKPRSSTFAKKSIHSLYGTIDETYEGELVFACQYIPEFSLIHTKFNEAPVELLSLYKELTINFSDAVAQIIPIKRVEMETVEITNDEYDNGSRERDAVRKANGFGSTG